MKRFLRSLLNFVLEIALSAGLVASNHVYPDVAWADNLTYFLTWGWLTFGCLVALSSLSTLSDVKKHFEKHGNLRELKPIDRQIFDRMQTVRGRVRWLLGWISGLTFVMALAICGWFVVALVQLVLVEIMLPSAVSAAQELQKKADEKQVAGVQEVLTQRVS